MQLQHLVVLTLVTPAKQITHHKMLQCYIYPRSRNHLRLFARERRERGELDFYVVSFVQIIVHSTGQTDRPDLGGAPCPFPTVGKAKPQVSICIYLVQAITFCGLIHSWIGETRSIYPVSGFISALMKVNNDNRETILYRYRRRMWHKAQKIP